jgi:small-conductance mechanosensitive channel
LKVKASIAVNHWISERVAGKSKSGGVAKRRGGERSMNIALWIIQALLAALFLFAGVTKLVLPIEEMTKQIAMPGLFLRFIGVCEVLGAIGLILPWLLGIRPGLTSLAAAGLVLVMIGATIVTAMTGDIVMALFPLVVGILCAFVAYGRTPHRG